MDISTIPLKRRTLLHVMEGALARRPDQIALRDPDRALTYAEAWTEALRLSRGLSTAGLARQQGVLLMLDNHVDSALCWLALGLGGCYEVSINTAYKGEMLAYMVEDSGAELLVVEQHYLARLIDVAGALSTLRTVIVRGSGGSGSDDIAHARRHWQVRAFEEAGGAEAASPERLDPWDLFSITYTSGTTGRSKGVLCPHAHAFCQATVDGLGVTNAGETRYIVLPQFHAAGRWGGVYQSLVHGGTAYIAPAFSASRFWELARAAGASNSQLVGTMANFLYNQPPGPGDRAHGLREICILPLPPNLAKWKQRFGVEVTTSYGSTEVGPIISTTETNSASVGRPREGYEVRIVDEHDVELPDESVGEAVVRPALPWTTSIGYLNRPKETAEVWRNGWLHTGDALYRDADGNFFFVDRIDDAIRRRGENISSAEVEMHVGAHPAVSECAAVAVPSEHVEDEIKIVVVRKPGADITESGLIAFLTATMPRFMVPRYVQFVAELPKTVTAKVRKRELRDAGVAGVWDATRDDEAAMAGGTV